MSDDAGVPVADIYHPVFDGVRPIPGDTVTFNTDTNTWSVHRPMKWRKEPPTVEEVAKFHIWIYRWPGEESVPGTFTIEHGEVRCFEDGIDMPAQPIAAWAGECEWCPIPLPEEA